MLIAAFFTCLSFLAMGAECAAESKHWALIVAGSNTWYNYRHQVS